MRLLSLSHSPLSRLPYVAPDGSRALTHHHLEILHGEVDALPATLDAVFCTSDLQGRIAPNGVLLGEALAAHLVELSATGVLPAPERMGAILCGDLLARPGLERRGGNGDVRPVWKAFARAFHWVAGVAGNHDHFGASPRDLERFSREPGIHFLDGQCVEIDTLRIGGVSGIVGNARRPFRRDAQNHACLVKELLEKRPDMLVLHEGPPEQNDATGKGNLTVREALESGPPTFCCFGHKHWNPPFENLPNRTTLLNVDARVVVLRVSNRTR